MRLDCSVKHLHDDDDDEHQLVIDEDDTDGMVQSLISDEEEEELSFSSYATAKGDTSVSSRYKQRVLRVDN